MRNRKAALRRLTDEQEAALGSGLGILLVDKPGETNHETLVRVFGSFEAVSTAWYDHRVRLLAEDPTPGRRPPGYWVVERHRDAPPVDEQAAQLRDLGELSASEEATLATWAAMTPDPPADLALDHRSVIPISDSLFEEEPPEIAQAFPLPHTVEADPGPTARAPPEAVVQTPEVQPEHTKETPMRQSPSPIHRGIDDRKPAALEGWE
jgi:hypothetical protein